MGQNRVEKITERFAAGVPQGQRVHAGDFVSIRPAHVMTHDNTGAVIPKFRSIGASRIFDPRQPVFILDHDVQNESADNLAKYAAIEAFAREHGIVFYPARTGIGHQVMVEEGFVLPGTLVVASDSHSNLYGGLGALGTPIVRTDAAAIWATGETWWQVPDVARVTLTGRLHPGVSGKDVIIALIGLFHEDEVLNCAIEFDGEGISCLSVDQRLTIANMTTEWGALAGVFPFDAIARSWLLDQAARQARRGDPTFSDRGRGSRDGSPRLTPEIIERAARDNPIADPDAFYAKEITLDLGSVVPHVAGPNEVKTIAPLEEIERKRIPIQKAYLLSCVNGRLEDIAEAAEVLKGRQVAEGVEFYLTAASAAIEAEAKRLGTWQILIDAGARPLPPGCGPCIGLGIGLIGPGETGISATNRNFKGRMGHREGNIYLASPAVVAASAAAGHIAAPAPMRTRALTGSVRENESPELPPGRIAIRSGFPRAIEGRLLWVDQDNLNTDGIYGKDYTYQDGMTPEQMARVAMLNYDPKFQEIAQVGDILAGGWNFGSGSSREQAATCLKYRGIPLVIAGSYSQTYKRNAFNNGYIAIECPRLIKLLRDRYAGRVPTRRTELMARVDFEAGTIRVWDGGPAGGLESGSRSDAGAANATGAGPMVFAFSPLREVAQELVALGGFEAVLAARLGRGSSKAG